LVDVGREREREKERQARERMLLLTLGEVGERKLCYVW